MAEHEIADYFDRTKANQARALKKLGHRTAGRAASDERTEPGTAANQVESTTDSSSDGGTEHA